jgi:nitrogen fixation NifU-like protein
MLEDLYQELILDHSKNPRNFGEMEDSDRQAEGYNPLCGDHIHIYVKLDGETLEKVNFDGKGCAICTASASLMTEGLKGKSLKESEALFCRFHSLMTGCEQGSQMKIELGKLEVLEGVKNYPIRVKCATLPWHTFEAALSNREEPVTTE